MKKSIKLIISEVSSMPVSEILNSTHLVNDLGLDSLDIFLLVLKLEDCFKINISDHDYPRLMTLKSLDVYVAEKLLS